MKHQKTLVNRCVVLCLLSLSQVAVSQARAQAINPASGQQAQSASTDLSSKQIDYSVNTQAAQIIVTASRNNVPADGQSSVQLNVQVIDSTGQPVKGEVVLTLQATGGRLLLPGAYTDELGPGRLDADKVAPGSQLRVPAGGRASFQLLAPIQPQDVKIQVSAGRALAEGVISFVPALRDWVAAGFLEGIISLRRVNSESAITPVRVNDGFEDKLRNFEREFNNGKTSTAARAAFFVKGTIKGEYLLSMSYDSDKLTRTRMLRDIRPDQLYPVFGDASIKTYEAQSSQRLYVRVDQGKNYVLYGDFNTGAGFTQVTEGGQGASLNQRELGNYNRTVSGLRGHYEWSEGSTSTAATTLQAGRPKSVLNVFVSKDTLRQLVEDIAGNGTSGPFALRSNNAIDNSEKIEILIRDRNNPGLILSSKPLVRYDDYTFDPFSGRILLKGPLSSADAFGNPQSLRVSYEVDQGGVDYWVYGVDGQIRINDTLDVGGSYVTDRNPGQSDPVTGARLGQPAGTYLLKNISSANIGLNLSKTSRVVVEVARSENATASSDIQGKALRLQGAWQSSEGSLKLQARHSQADTDFYNPGASVNLGRRESALGAQWAASDKLTVQASASVSEDKSLATPSHREGLSLSGKYDVNPELSVRIGLRRSKDNGSGLYTPAGLAGPGSGLYSGSGLTASGGGFLGQSGVNVIGSTTTAGGQVPGYATVTGAALETSTANLGLQYRPSQRLTIDAEAEQSISEQKANRLALGARYQVLERTALNARYETQTGLGSYYDRAQRNSAFVLGVANDYQLSGDTSGQAFSEYRLRDSLSGREAQLATGLRNTVDLAPGWRAVIGLERLRLLSGSGANATSLALGLDYSGSGLWRGATRLELRHTGPTAAGNDATDSLLHTLTLARKISRDWTGLASHFYTRTDAQGIAGEQSQRRIQMGAAYRPVDNNRLDTLFKLENRREYNGELAQPEHRHVWVASMHTNWHPKRQWWVSTRFATKQVDETLDNAVRDTFSARLLSGRVIYDISEKVDVSAMSSVLTGEGSRQMAYGLEAGYALATNLWISLGYNWAGFRDRDLTGAEYTAKGGFLRLRFKFDEKLWRSQRSDVNSSLER